jgi:putative PIN family toxin of toxin-antitoxin system
VSPEKKSLKAVIDTNILVSGLFAGSGTIFELMELWADGRFELVTSDEILDELYRVLHKPTIRKHFKPAETDIAAFVELVRERAVITPNLYKTDVITSDPTDNKFLVAALEANADFIVSGDRHLKDVREFEGTRIVDAKTFVEEVKKG